MLMFIKLCPHLQCSNGLQWQQQRLSPDHDSSISKVWMLRNSSNGNAPNMKFAAQMTPDSSVLSIEDINIPSIGIHDELLFQSNTGNGLFLQMQQQASVDAIASQQSSENTMNNMIIASYIVENDPHNNIRRNNNQNNNYTGHGNISINNVSNLHVIDAIFDQQPQPLHGRELLETNDTQTTSFDGDADVGVMALLTLDDMPRMKNINNVHSINSSNNNDRLMPNRIMISVPSRSRSSSSSRVANVTKHNLNSSVSIDTVVGGAENRHRGMIDSNVARQCEIVTNTKYMNGHTRTQEIQVQTADGFMDNNDKNHSRRCEIFVILQVGVLVVVLVFVHVLAVLGTYYVLIHHFV